MHARYPSLLSLAALLAGGVGLPASGQSAPSQPSWSADDCVVCHATAVTPAFNLSQHARLEQGCASCHDNVADHLRTQQAGGPGSPVPTVPTVKGSSPTKINETCLACHDKGNQSSWLSSVHDRRRVACTSCHAVHDFKSARAQLKTRQAAETCYACHKEQRARAMRTSHHPVREGKLDCSSCHDPHEGDAPKMVKAATVNELCYQCHAEKRGPFLFEHAPVREDCVSCHEPHGSNHSRLLVQKEPTLCWNCHFTGSGHFGSGDNFSTEQGVPTAPPGAPSGFPTVNSRFIGRGCTKCHMNVHGSNSPSGAFFVR